MPRFLTQSGTHAVLALAKKDFVISSFLKHKVSRMEKNVKQNNTKIKYDSELVSLDNRLQS